MHDDLPLVLDRIHAHLDADPPASSAVAIAEMEHTLTDGYALALALEAARARADRSIHEVAHAIDDPVRLEELRALAERRADAERDLGRLRALLGRLREQLEAGRAAV